MKKKILSFLVLMFAIATISFLFWNPVFAQTDPTIDGLNESAKKVTAYDTSASYTNFLQTKAGVIIGVVLSFVGVLFLALMIYSGITWMTAQGNEQQVTKAKGLLINAVIGIIIVFAAYAITSFIGSNFLG